MGGEEEEDWRRTAPGQRGREQLRDARPGSAACGSEPGERGTRDAIREREGGGEGTESSSQASSPVTLLTAVELILVVDVHRTSARRDALLTRPVTIG